MACRVISTRSYSKLLLPRYLCATFLILWALGLENWVNISFAVIGLVAAAISFIVHKFNPQSRMPGWITCLVIGLVGALAMGGVAKPIEILEQGRDLIYEWFGL